MVLMTTERTHLKRKVFMAIASQLSLLGTCDRKHVGAVLVRDGRCISWGFNGAPEGAPHCEENWHGYMDPLHPQFYLGPVPPDEDAPGEEMAEWAVKEFGCRNATHAEANALAFAARQGISTDSCTLFVTVSPCEVCARLLIAAGINTVWYLEEYRDRGGIELLERALVQCHQLES